MRLHIHVLLIICFILAVNFVRADDPPAPATQPALTPKGIEGVGLTAEQVNQSIDHGAEFLWKYLKEKDLKHDQNSFGNDPYHLLCALALVHSDAHKKFPDFDAALRHLLANAKPSQMGIYNAGLLNMLIDSYGDPQFNGVLQQSTRYLFESQGPKGMFEYNGCARVFDAAAIDQGNPLEIVGMPPAGEKGSAWTHRLEPKPGYDGDNSVTQFASLGLLSATRCGIMFPDQTWQGILSGYRERQFKNGGWGYNAGGVEYGSMTCAGLCNVAIARFELGEKEPANDPAITRGMAWLDTHFSITENPNRNNWAFYYLYSLERVGQILQTEFIGSHEWYPLGAKYLVTAQKTDGSWIGKSEEADPRLSTSFSLLFLTRATPPLRHISTPDQMGTLRTSVIAPPGIRIYVILDCSGSMLDEIEGKQKFKIARDAVAKLISQLPPETNVALRAYGHRKSALDKGCDEDTELLIPMGKLNAKTFAAKIEGLRARGKTPLALSLQDIKKDLGAGSQPTQILLLTDGGEDTLPRKDPVKAATDLGKSKNITLDIVGFDVENRDEWKQQLQSMAKEANGNYFPAAHEQDLDQQILQAVFKRPDFYTIIDAEGKEVARGTFGDTKTLAPAKYTIKTRYNDVEMQQTFWINSAEQTGVNFNATKAEKATSRPSGN